MRIKIRSQEKNLNLNFPTKLLLNRFTAKIAIKAMNENIKTDNTNISSKDLRRLFDEIHRIKRKYPNLELVNVESANGDTVVIKL